MHDASARGNSARGDSALGNSALGDSARGNSALGDSGRGDSARHAAARTMLAGVAEACAIVERRTGPLSIQVTGRGGVGKSVVVTLLQAGGLAGTLVRETGGVDVPRTPEPVLDGDLVVYVLAGVPSAADLDVVNKIDDAIVVLGKADTFDDLAGVVARSEDATGRAVYPLMGTIALGAPLDYRALRSLASAGVDASVFLGADLLFDADLPVSVAARRALVDAVELWGVAKVVDTLHRKPAISDADVGAMLREQSGLDAFLSAVRAAVVDAEARRDHRMSAALRTLAAQSVSARDAVENYLATDDAVLADMNAWMVMLGVAEVPVDRAVREASAWRTRAAQSPDPRMQRAAIAVSRGLLRVAAQ